MNVHHLELFYYVAKYEGITAAVKKMPYGIQQPAVSGQILQLEAELGVKLFNRRPFALTPEGEDLYDYCYPFFSKMKLMEEHLKGELKNHLRICASASVLRHHLPDVLEQMKLKNPDLRLSLKEVEPSAIFVSLANQEADIAVSVINGKLTNGMKCIELLRLPLILLVPKTVNIKNFKDLIEPDPDATLSRSQPVSMRSKIPLVGLPPHETIQQIFQTKVSELNLNWDVSVEVNSLDVVQSYVSRGFGAGLSVAIPGRAGNTEGCNVIPLDDFPPLVIGAIYQGSLKPIAEQFLNETNNYAKKLK